ncbi:MAG: hypothetical protein RSB75_03255 [Anaerovoracaceae bacterium]
MAIATMAIEALNLWKQIDIASIVDIGVILLSFLFMLLGTIRLAHYRSEYRKAMILSAIGAGATLLELVLVLIDIKKGAEGVFQGIEVMFMAYIGTLAMLGVFYFVIRGNAQLLAKHGEIKLAKKSLRVNKMATIVILITLLVIPGAYVFPLIVKYVLAGLGIAGSVFVKMYMCNIIDRGYKILHGRRG